MEWTSIGTIDYSQYIWENAKNGNQSPPTTVRLSRSDGFPSCGTSIQRAPETLHRWPPKVSKPPEKKIRCQEKKGWNSDECGRLELWSSLYVILSFRIHWPLELTWFMTRWRTHVYHCISGRGQPNLHRQGSGSMKSLQDPIAQLGLAAGVLSHSLMLPLWWQYQCLQSLEKSSVKL